MAQYLGTLRGNRGEISRTGSKDSGMAAEINGWGIGARICIRYDEKRKKDFITIIQTGGSNRKKKEKTIKEIKER